MNVDCSNVWITTNHQPWVEALAAGLITAKTRTSRPVVKPGAVVLLHASKSRLWRFWDGLTWTKDLDSKAWERGAVVAIARVANVGPSEEILTEKEYKFWDVYQNGKFFYNSVAEFSVRFKDIVRLKNPVYCRGFQAPFVHAKPATVSAVVSANPKLESYLT